jgi:biotin carboxylase
MAKRVLILGANPDACGIVRKARTLGFYTVALDGAAGSALLQDADEGHVANFLDAHEIIRVAGQAGADGIYPPPEPAVIAAAEALVQLGMAGFAPDVAVLTRNKAALREALASHGLPHAPFRVARTVPEALRAGRALGVPLIVKPADAYAGKCVQQVDHLEDLSLSVTQALRASFLETVLLEAVMPGPEFLVEGVVSAGGFAPIGVLALKRSAAPCCVIQAISTPPDLSAGLQSDLFEAVGGAVSALRFGTGYIQVKVICTASGPCIVNLHGYPAATRLPCDLMGLAYGIDTTEMALRIAVGETPVPRTERVRGAALLWIPSHSGVVSEVRGIEAARKIAHVAEVNVTARPGDVLGHVVDCATRDRLGYVLSTADQPKTALASAQEAVARCEIVTRPAY